MGQINSESTHSSGIKVLDRAVHILLTVAKQPRSLSELCEATALPRATAHRLATALEAHNILTRTSDGKWAIGNVLTSLGAGSSTQLIDVAAPIMANLVETTGESIQLYQLAGTTRVCIAAQEPPFGLQNTVPVGSRLPLSAGSAAKVFLAYSSPNLRDSILENHDTQFTIEELHLVKEQGWAESIAEREVGLASITAPVFHKDGLLLAALSISGPAERFKPSPKKWADVLTQAATTLSEHL